jgi:diguanylate cyclase (GGDEF)-like protein
MGMTGSGARRWILPATIAAGLLTGDAFAAGLVARHAGAAAWAALAGVAVLAAAAGALAAAWARGARRRDRRLRRLGRELDELLQACASAAESQRLLLDYAQRVLPGAGAGILAVADGGSRLEPTLADRVDHTPLRGIRTAGLGPRGCLAIRLAHGHARGADDRPLMACEVCGGLDAEVVCEPMPSGGETVGALIVAAPRPIGPDERQLLSDVARRGAPVLAGQRDIARAQERAVSDELTGLPNRRAADETIRRMVAHAGRALSPLGVVLLDLDRFRVLNELHGRSHGDKALAAVGRLLAATARASDFVARYGGEEFLLVLPDTDRLGSLEVAEKIRRALERAELVQTGPITASLGVACLPDDAVDPDHLIRQADRALYMAKAHGRNRVQAADPSARPA